MKQYSGIWSLVDNFSILKKDDYKELIKILEQKIENIERHIELFRPVAVIFKKYTKPKSSKQHRYYWKVVSEAVKAFKKQGYQINSEQVHEFAKKSIDYMEAYKVNGKDIFITKSISNKSEDIDSKIMTELVDFLKRFCLENLDYHIE